MLFPILFGLATAQTPCTIPGLTGDLQCSTVRVPEDRSKPNGHQIDIFVAIARATGDRREPDPFLYLAGGPGQAASESGDFASQTFSRVREHRDLVFIDARGTGRSNPLRCALNRKPADFGAASMYPATSVRFCRDSLSRTVDLRRYTSADIADDIESVRVAMGWPKLNFYGTSYGTRLGFTFLRRHESSVRTMTLKAVAPPSLVAPMNYAEDAEHAFVLLERDCRADTACARAFPNPRADLMRVLARADSGRIRTVLPSGDTIVVARDAIAGTLMTALQSNSERSRLPALLRQAAMTDGAVLGGLIAQTRRTIDAMLYTGMHLSVSCSEDAKHLDVPAARGTDNTTFLGSARVRMLADACADWTTGDEERGRTNAPRSNAPILLVSGELDPNTPPHHAESILGGLPNARHVVLTGVAHNWSNAVSCGRDFVAEFVASASVKSLDVSCAAKSSAPPFVVPR